MIKEVLIQVTYGCPDCGAEYCSGLILDKEWREEKYCDGDELAVEGCGHEWVEPLDLKYHNTESSKKK